MAAFFGLRSPKYPHLERAVAVVMDWGNAVPRYEPLRARQGSWQG